MVKTPFPYYSLLFPNPIPIRILKDMGSSYRKYWPKQVDTFLRDMNSWLTPQKTQEEIKDKVAELHREACARSYHAKEVEKAKAKEERKVAVAKARAQRKEERKQHFWGQENQG